MLRRFRWLLAVLVLLFALWCGLWYFATGKLLAEIEAGAANLTGDGLTLTLGERQRAGFPTHIAARLTDIQLRHPNGSVTTAALAVSIAPWRPNELRIDLPAPLRFVAPTLAPLTLTAAQATLTLAQQTDARTATLLAQHVEITPEGGKPGAAGPLSLRLSQSVPAPSDARSALGRLSLDVADITAPGFGLPTDRLTLGLDLVLSGPAVTSSVPGQSSAKALVTSWSEAGGKLDLPRALVIAGPSRIEADGTFALDGALRPIGAATVTVRNHVALLEGLTNHGVLSPRNALAGRMLLQGMAQPDGVVKVPVTLQDGWLTFGPLRVIPLPPLLD